MESISPRAPLAIPAGGTGATSASGALVSLGVPMGEVETIAVGPGLSGGGSGTIVPVNIQQVSVLQGGTGAGTAVAARGNLGAAGLASPAFTGFPTMTGVIPATDNSTRLTTTAWVTSKLAAFTAGVDGGVF